MKKNKLSSILLIVSTLLVIIGINILANSRKIRLDMTEGGIYSLSDQSKKTIRELNDIITIRLYFSADMPPALMTAKQQVEDIADEFKSMGKGNIKVERIDPSVSQFDEQKAMMVGVAPFDLSIIKQDKQEMTRVYFGMVVLYGEKFETIPLIQGVNNLEYSVIQAIIRLTSNDLMSVGWLEHPKDGMTYELVKNDLKQRYNFIEMRSVTEINNKSIDALIVISPREWSIDEQKLLEKYYLSGGKVLLLVDRYLIDNSLKSKEIKVSLLDILNKYGVHILPQFVVDSSNAMAAFTANNNVTYKVPYPFWILVRNDQINKDVNWLNNTDAVVLPWTSPIDIKSPNVQVLTSSQNSKTVSYPFDLNPQSKSNDVLPKTDIKYSLMAEIKTIREPFFEEHKKVVLNNAGRILVVSNSYFASDFFIQQFLQNFSFFSNMADSLLIGDMLSDVRAKTSNMRPIASISDEAKMFLRYANVIINPLLIILLGVIVLIYRKTSRRHRFNNL